MSVGGHQNGPHHPHFHQRLLRIEALQSSSFPSSPPAESPLRVHAQLCAFSSSSERPQPPPTRFRATSALSRCLLQHRPTSLRQFPSPSIWCWNKTAQTGDISNKRFLLTLLGLCPPPHGGLIAAPTLHTHSRLRTVRRARPLHLPSARPRSVRTCSHAPVEKHPWRTPTPAHPPLSRLAARMLYCAASATPPQAPGYRRTRPFHPFTPA